MDDEKKRKTLILTFIGALTLLFVVVGGTYAYFQIVSTGEGETTSTLTGETEDLTKYGTPTLTQGTSNLHINLKASDMGYSNKGTEYWATNVEENDYETDKQQHVISTAKISEAESEDTELSCTSELTIKGKITEMVDGESTEVSVNPLVEEDGYVYLGTKNGGSNKVSINPNQIDLKQIIDKSLNDGAGYQTEVSYTIKGNSSIDITVDIDIINRDANQNDLAGKSINFTITNKNISCSVKGPKGKAYMRQVGTEWQMTDYMNPFYYEYGEWFDSDILRNIVSAAFVDYIPSDLEDSKIVKYIDLSDIENGTPKGSVIAWVEETEEHNGEYNFYIGSESTIYAESLSVFFAEMIKLQNIDFSNLDTSETISMSGMFDMGNYYGDMPVINLDLSELDTSHVEYMSYMFKESNINITFPKDFGSAATNMSSMFEGYKGTKIDLSNFDTSHVKYMSKMFSGTYGSSYGINAEIIFPQGFGSSAIYMDDMFKGYYGSTLDLSNLNTSQVTDMSGMFMYYHGTELDLSNFDTSKVINMVEMFFGVKADLPFKDWPKFVTTNVENMSAMFQSYKGKTLDLSTFDTSKVTDMGWMFRDVSIDLPFKDWPKFVTSKVEEMDYMFYEYEGTSLDLSTFDTSKVWIMSYMFYDCINLTELDLRSFDTSSLTKMAEMFNNCKSLKVLDLSSFTFDNIDASNQFGGGNYSTFYNVPSSCQVKIKSSQQGIFEDKFPTGGYWDRRFTPQYVD